MNRDLWTAVDRYLTDQLVPADPALAAALATSASAGLPDIAVSPNHGKLLHLIAKIQGARRILEIGTLGGYSTIWLARALPPGGNLISLEFDPKHADVARANIGNAGLGRMVQVHFLDLVRAEPRVEATAIQTVGIKGYDGLAIVRVLDGAEREARRG